jgi:hypothetical protein
MARGSDAAGDEATAGKEYAEFADAWKDGNPDLPQVAHAREYSCAKDSINSYEVETTWVLNGAMIRSSQNRSDKVSR